MANGDTSRPADLLERPSYRGRAPVQELGLLAVIILLMSILTIAGFGARARYANAFFNFDNLVNGVATPMAIYAIMAVGMTFVIITGGIDISVGSVFGFAAIAGAWVLQYMPFDAPLWKVLPVAVGVPCAVGLTCGLLNGSLVVWFRLHPFIVTLATMGIFRGIATVAPAPITTLPSGDRYLPASFTHLIDWSVYGLRPVPMVIMVGCVAIGWFYLSWTVAGRENYAVGGNEEASRYSGIRVARVKLRVYALMGLAAGLAAMVTLGRYGTASTSTGEYDELAVIAAAVVGGASLSGGRGTALGALLGALVIRLIINGIDILGINQSYSKIIVGIAIIAAAVIDRLSQYFRSRRLGRSAAA